MGMRAQDAQINGSGGLSQFILPATIENCPEFQSFCRRDEVGTSERRRVRGIHGAPTDGCSPERAHSMHGPARLRLVERISAEASDCVPQSLPFPECIRSLPIRSPRAAFDGLEALEAVSRKMDDLARALGCTTSDNDKGGRPRAA